MTDFHKLFMVKITKMIKKKTGGIFLVVYVIYGSLVYTDSKKLCLVYSSDCQLHAICATFERYVKCKLLRIHGGLCLFHYVLNNKNWLVFVCFVQFNNQLDV